MTNPAEESRDLLIIPPSEAEAQAAFAGDFDKVWAPILEKVRARVTNFQANPIDLSIEADRDKIKSFAWRISRSKTAVDDAGKTLVAKLKQLPKKIDANRKRIRDQLDAWRDEVREPLDRWEEAEQTRIDAHVARIESIRRQGETTGTAAELAELIDRLRGEREHVNPEEFGEEYEITRQDALRRLTAAHAAAVVSEAQAAELARLRASEAQREAEERKRQLDGIRAMKEAREREEALERQAAEARQRHEAELAEARREADEARRKIEQAEAARIAGHEKTLLWFEEVGWTSMTVEALRKDLAQVDRFDPTFRTEEFAERYATAQIHARERLNEAIARREAEEARRLEAAQEDGEKRAARRMEIRDEAIADMLECLLGYPLAYPKWIHISRTVIEAIEDGKIRHVRLAAE